MKRWIVNASERSVREADHADNFTEERGHLLVVHPGEFVWDGSYADAMAAGARRRLAEEAYNEAEHVASFKGFCFVADRIESQCSDPSNAASEIAVLTHRLELRGFDVWREGTGLIVLGRLPT